MHKHVCMHMCTYICPQVCIYSYIYTYIYTYMHTYTYIYTHSYAHTLCIRLDRCCTGCQRPTTYLVGLCLIFRKRATNYRALLRKMTCKDKASYDSTPHCTCVPPLTCTCFAKEPLIIGLFCGKWPMKIRNLMTLRHPVCRMTLRHTVSRMSFHLEPRKGIERDHSVFSILGVLHLECHFSNLESQSLL